MEAKKHDKDRDNMPVGAERIDELEQGGMDGPHGPHSGPLATDKLPNGKTKENKPDQDEFGTTAEIDKNKIGSKDGFNMSADRDHETGGDSHEHTGSENREGMGSGTQAGPAHQGHIKPGRRHGKP